VNYFHSANSKDRIVHNCVMAFCYQITYAEDNLHLGQV